MLVGCTVPAYPPKEASPGARLLEKIPIPPLDFRVPQIGREVERTVLPNGIVLYLASDPAAATLDLFIACRAGRLYRDGAPVGVGEATAYLLRSGGTTTFGHQRFAEQLERQGISIEVATGMELVSFSVSALNRHADHAVALAADMLRHPVFDPAPLKAYKGQVLDVLRRLPDSPMQVLPRHLARLLYTEAHPAGRFVRPADIQSIRRDDLFSFWRRFIRPDNMWIAATGRESTADLRKRITGYFRHWDALGPVTVGPAPPVEPRTAPGIYFLPRPLAQSSVLLGHLGISRGNPDRHAIEILNLILGGNGFASRLIERLRTREGLAYAVGSSFPTTNPSRSLFRVSVQTASDKVPRAIEAVREEIRRLQIERVSAPELAAAKEFVANAFAFRFASRASTARQLLSLEVQNRPLDDFDTLMDRFAAITSADVQRAARRYLRPDEMTILVMGGPGTLAESLRALGPVRPLVLPEYSN